MERIWLKSYPEGVPADINPTAYASIGDFFAANVDRYRDRTAYVCMGRTMSYGELDRLSRAFASYLQNVARLPRGARVALMMPNLLQYPVALFGALRAGYVVVNCNPLYSPRELIISSTDSGAEAIVVLENFAQTLEKAIDGTQVRVVVVDRRRRSSRGPDAGSLVNFVLRHVRRAVPAWRLPQARALQPRAVARAAADGRVPAGRAGRHRVPAIHRRHDRRAQGRDAHPPQHDRQPAAGARLGRPGRSDRPRKCS